MKNRDLPRSEDRVVGADMTEADRLMVLLNPCGWCYELGTKLLAKRKGS